MSILTTMAMLASIWACKPTSGKDTPDSTAKPDTDISGKADEASTVKEVEQKLNSDLISDLGLTYVEIIKKYGNPIKAKEYSGAPIFYFENTCGAYGFGGWDGYDLGGDSPDTSEISTDKDGYWILGNNSYPRPKDNIECNIISLIKSKDLFLGMAKTTDIANLEKIYGVKHVLTEEDKTDENKGIYRHSFTFDDKIIYSESNKENALEMDSYLGFRYFQKS